MSGVGHRPVQAPMCTSDATSTMSQQQDADEVQQSNAAVGATLMSAPDDPSGTGPPAECAITPMEGLREAVANADANAAHRYYGELDAEEHATFFGDRNLQIGVIDLIGHSFGISAAQEIFSDLCLSVAGQIRLADDANLLDADNALTLINAPGVDAATQRALVATRESYERLHRVLGDRDVSAVFLALAADPEQLVQACGGPLWPWAMGDLARAQCTIALTPEIGPWLPVMIAHNAGDLVLQLAASSEDFRWSDAYQANQPAFVVLCAGLPRPIPENRVDGFRAIFGEGDGFDHTSRLVAFGVLYGDGLLARSGQDWDRNVSSARSGTVDGRMHHVYHAVTPNSDAMGLFFTQFAMIPRPQVRLATKILMTDYHQRKFVSSGNDDRWLNGNSFVDTRAAASQVSLTTSYYTSEGYILMRSLDSVGTPDTNLRPDMGTGPGLSARSVNRMGLGTDGASPNPDMNLFQNHATHEVGHAVGARPLNVAPANGTTPDDYTKRVYRWDNGSAEGFARSLGFTATMDGTNYNLADAGGTVAVTASGRVIREFLAGYAAGQNPAPAELIGAGKFATAAAALAAIGNHDVLKLTLLFRTVRSNRGSASEGFMFPYGVDSGASDVHFFCTRWRNNWVKYAKSGYDERPSHYAVSSYKEYFAEVYTAHYTGGVTAAGLESLFVALDASSAADFGALGGGGGGGDEAVATGEGVLGTGIDHLEAAPADTPMA